MSKLTDLLDRENVLARKCDTMSKFPKRWSVTREQILEVTDELHRVRGRIKFYENMKESGL